MLSAYLMITKRDFILLSSYFLSSIDIVNVLHKVELFFVSEKSIRTAIQTLYINNFRVVENSRVIIDLLLATIHTVLISSYFF